MATKVTDIINFIGRTVAKKIITKTYEIDLWFLEKPKDINYESIQRHLRRLGRKNATVKFPGGLAFGISVGMRKRGRWHLEPIKVCAKPPHTRKKRRHYTQVR